MTDTEEQFLIDDLLAGGITADPLETAYMPAGRALKVSARRRFERLRQKQQLTEVIPQLPAPGESIHVVSTAKYDFWTFVPQIIDWIGFTEILYCSTWTLSRPNAMELFALADAGKIGQIAFLTGLYFKRRETAVYAMLLAGIRARGGRYRAFLNHAKVLLAANPDRDAWLVVEGSANLTGNPRLEQYVFTNDRKLYEFHAGWMEECLKK